MTKQRNYINAAEVRLLRVHSPYIKVVTLAGAIWILFWLFCRPVVVLHYASNATKPVTYFVDEQNDTTKDHLNPGEVLKIYTVMFPAAGSSIDVSLPFSSRDGVTLTTPFSRVDIYIDADAKIQRTIIHHGFFARFSSP